MAKLLVLYKKAADAAAFDAYYTGTHIPIAKKIPGLRKYEVSRGPVFDPSGASPYELIATLTFDSMEAIRAALGSPEGGAAAGDLGNFTQAGVELVMYDTKDI